MHRKNGCLAVRTISMRSSTPVCMWQTLYFCAYGSMWLFVKTLLRYFFRNASRRSTRFRWLESPSWSSSTRPLSPHWAKEHWCVARVLCCWANDEIFASMFWEYVFIFCIVWCGAVMVYRLITKNTIDQRILERAEAKRKLEKLVIHKVSSCERHSCASLLVVYLSVWAE